MPENKNLKTEVVLSEMKISKRIANTIPTVAYGNVIIDISVSETFDCRKEIGKKGTERYLKEVKNHGHLLNKALYNEYVEQHSMLSGLYSETNKLTSLDET